MATALLVTLTLNWQGLWMSLLNRPEFFTGSGTVVFAKTALTTTVATTLVWIVVTLATAPEPQEVLIAFYRKVRPDVTGWTPIATLTPDVSPTHDLGRNLWCWILGTVMVYCALFGVGKILLQHYRLGGTLVVVAILAAWQMTRELSRTWVSEGSQVVSDQLAAGFTAEAHSQNRRHS
jgi:hypothetical protein